MATAQRTSDRSVQMSTIRKLKRELAAARRDLETERRLRRELALKILPLCPKKLEDQIPDIKELKDKIANEPSFEEFLKSLWK